MYLLLLFIPFLSAQSLEIKNDLYHTSSKANFSILMAHGLNNKESVMNDLKSLIPRDSFNYLSIELTGHKSDYEAFKSVIAKQWQEDLYTGWLKLKKLKKPIYFIGYSLGALVAISLLKKKDNILFEKMILFAPALSTKWYVNFAKLFFLFSDDTIIPSFAPKEYRANHGTSIAAYKALFTLIDEVQANDNKKLAIPTAILIDPRDELVSHSGLIHFITNHKLQQYWNIQKIASQNKFKHLIVDKKSLSPKQWKIVRKIIAKDFNFEY